MTRAPRLFTPRRTGKVTGEVVLVLIGIVHFQDALIFPSDLFLEEVPAHFTANEEDDLGKTGPLGIVDGIVHQGFAARADRVELLESAVAEVEPMPAARTRRDGWSEVISNGKG